ncbi:pseudouridine synthase [Helicobacter bilis]|uniref:pseudouridine synthase n=1 Tax=Helicobacter bilis TaxID=37372 RepID=UPI002557D0C7|nr:pseudouridine synthase [Helicobacter bilis]
MGFKTISLQVAERIKATHFLLQNGYSKKDTQKLLDKNRIRQDSKIIHKKDFLEKGHVEILSFMPDDIKLIPFFACVPPNHVILQQNIANLEIKISQNPPYFCVFNKPSKLLTHPKNLADSKSILDSLRYYFGTHANPCHRLDYETSGLLVCSIDKQSEVMLKNLFLQKGVRKSYMAILHGEITQSLLIESEIIFPKDFGNLCIKGRAKNLKVKTIKEDEIKIITKDSIQQDQSRATTILTPLHVFHSFNEVSSYLYKSSNPFFSSNSSLLLKSHSFYKPPFLQKPLFSHKKPSLFVPFSLSIPQENLANKYMESSKDSILFTTHNKRVFIQDSFKTCNCDKNPKQDSIHKPQKAFHITLQYSDFFNEKKLLQCYESFLNGWGAGFRVQNNILDSHTCHTEPLGEVSKKLDFTTAFHANFQQSKKEVSKNLESKQNEKFTLVKLFPLSGKTHQLRIHTSSLQHKILGDTLYGLCPVIASLFLDLQSKKLRANIESYLFETLTKKYSSSIQKYVYAIHYLRRDKNIAQTMLYNAMLNFSAACKNPDSNPYGRGAGFRTQNNENIESSYYPVKRKQTSKDLESKKNIAYLHIRTSEALAHTCKYGKIIESTPLWADVGHKLHFDKILASIKMHPKPCTHPDSAEILESKTLHNKTQYRNSKSTQNTETAYYKDIKSKFCFLPSYKFLSLSLSKILIPCFFSHSKHNKQYDLNPYYRNTYNKNTESNFFAFLLFYYALPSQQDKILKDIRLHYCSTDRLLLHTSSLSFLEECFISE